MATFCIGSCSVKRRSFKGAAGNDTICVDNDEVLATFTLNKKLYCVVGDIPFASLSIAEFISSAKSLSRTVPLKMSQIRNILKSVGIKKKLSTKMGKLSRIEYKAVSLAAKTDFNTKKIMVNFDGLEYNRKNSKKLNSYLSLWDKKYEVYAAVSDTRFVSKSAKVLNYTSNGVEQKLVKTQGKTISRTALKKRLAKMNLDINIPNIKKVVLCDK